MRVKTNRRKITSITDKIARNVIVVLLLFGYAAVAGALTVFTERSTWASALPTSRIETADFTIVMYPNVQAVLPAGSTTPLSSNLTIEGVGTGYVAFWSANSFSSPFDSIYLGLAFTEDVDQVIFQFRQPVHAIGFDYAGAEFEDPFIVSGINWFTYSPVPNESFEDIRFFGLTAVVPFSALTLSTGSDPRFTIDNFSFAHAVPLPPALLLLAGAAPLITVRRKATPRQHQSIDGGTSNYPVRHFFILTARPAWWYATVRRFGF